MMATRVLYRLLAMIGLFVLSVGTAAACDQEVPREQLSASASNTAVGSSVTNLIDGSTDTNWVSGGFAAQWVQLDLGSKRPLCKLRMTVLQSPAGNVKHTVLIGEAPESLVEFSVIQKYMADGDVIDIPIMANARYVRIRTDSSPSWVAWRELAIYSSQMAGMPANASGLKYYGYWGSGGFVDEPDPTPGSASDILYNATGAVHGYSNFTTARVWFLASRVAELNALGDTSSKVIVDLYDIFFNPSSQYVAEWQAHGMDALMQQYGDRIAAIILVDEPDVRGVGDAAMNERIFFLKSKLAALNRNIPIFIDYSYLAFDSGNWPGFANADWVSFNCYPQEHHPGSTDWNRYDLCYNSTLTNYINQIENKLAPSQKLVLLPQSFYRVAPGNAPTVTTPVPAIDKKQMVEVADHLMLFAENDPHVVAVMNFIYQSYDQPAGTPAEAWVGAEWLTDTDASRDVRGRLMEAGLCVKSALQGCLLRRLRPVSVSASASAGTAGQAFDDNPASSWNAGAFSSAGQKQWIRFEFARPVGISQINLTPSQSPVCAVTTHEVWGGSSEETMSLLAEYTGDTCDGASFTVSQFWRNNDLKVIEVRTIASPSWVAWREIQIYR